MDLDEFRAFCTAELDREAAEREAVATVTAKRLAVRGTTSQGPTSVLSVRLDAGEMSALYTRAELRGIKPTVLARNLIRVGLAERTPQALADAIERLAASVEEVRGLVS